MKSAKHKAAMKLAEVQYLWGLSVGVGGMVGVSLMTVRPLTGCLVFAAAMVGGFYAGQLAERAVKALKLDEGN